jgi:hypothetical protein
MKMSVLSLFIALLGFASCQTVETEHYLIPQGFTGRVTIVFDQKNGVPTKYEGRTRIYEIPSSGILLTQFHYDGGWIDHHYFYVDNTGKRIGLSIFKYEYNKDGTTKYAVKDKNEIGIMSDGTTGQATNEGAQFQFFFVSSVNGLDTMESNDHYNKRVNKLTGLSL